MDRSLQGRLEQALTRQFPPTLDLRVETLKDRFAILRGDAPPILVLWFDRGEWTVAGPSGHAHRDEFGEAVEVALALLSGKARFASEYRGETLAADWIEYWDGQAYEARDTAAFLSPFEAEEWTLWPGERWRVVRRTIRLDAPEGEETFERLSNESSAGGPTMLPSLERALGALPEGLRWAVDGGSRFVFPAPQGWRRRQDGDREVERKHSQSDFGPFENGLAFRKRCYFRDADAPTEPTGAQTFPPYRTQRGLTEPESVSPGWNRFEWTLLFTDGQEEMMGILQIYFVEATHSVAQPLAERIGASLDRARYVPGAWTMHPEV